MKFRSFLFIYLKSNKYKNKHKLDKHLRGYILFKTNTTQHKDSRLK